MAEKVGFAVFEECERKAESSLVTGHCLRLYKKGQYREPSTEYTQKLTVRDEQLETKARVQASSSHRQRYNGYEWQYIG